MACETVLEYNLPAVSGQRQALSQPSGPRWRRRGLVRIPATRVSYIMFKAANSLT